MKNQKISINSTYTKLLQLGAKAKELRSKASIKDAEAELLPLNHFIKKIHNIPHHTELKTFKKWIEAEFKVKKGEKGFLFFSAPKGINNKKDEVDNGNKKENENSSTDLFQKTRFFPCYLFAKNQVEEIE